MESVSVKWLKIENEDCYSFIFNGHFSAKEAREASKQWQDEFAKTPVGRRYHIVFDARQMSNYDAGARMQWQAVMKELQPQIKSIWLMSESSAIRAGAKMMSFFTSFSIKSVSKPEDISF